MGLSRVLDVSFIFISCYYLSFIICLKFISGSHPVTSQNKTKTSPWIKKTSNFPYLGVFFPIRNFLALRFGLQYYWLDLMRRRDLWTTSSTNVYGIEYRISADDAMITLQPVRVMFSICLYYLTIWNGSSILDPIIELHAVGQKGFILWFLLRYIMR